MIAIIPNYVFGESARYRQLVAEKQRKMAELEQCTGDVNGWKIAGISTLGLTAVGVAGNIALANKQSSLDDKIASTDKQIDNYNSKIDARRGEIMADNVKRSDCQGTGGKYTSAGCQCPDGMDLIGTICKVKNPEPVITQPNTPNQQGDEPKDSPVPNGSNGEDKNCKVGSYTLPHSDSASSNSVSCSSLAGGFDVTNGNVCSCTCQNGVANCVVDSCLNGYAPSANKKKCECDTAKDFEVNGEGKCVKKSDDKGKTVKKVCTKKAKELDSHVTKAVEINGKCEVTKCESGYTPKTDKTGCELEKTQKKISNLCLWNGQEQSKDFSLDSVSCDKAPGGWQYVVDERATKCNCSCVENTVNSELYWECKVVACDVANGYMLKDNDCVLRVGPTSTVDRDGEFDDNKKKPIISPVQQRVMDNGVVTSNNTGSVTPVYNTNTKVGKSCLTEAKKTEPHATHAYYNANLKCVIDECETRYSVSNGKCVKSASANTSNLVSESRVDRVFNDVNVNLSQGIALVKLWAKQSNIGTLNCENKYETVKGDDELVCSSNYMKYVFVFDDLNERYKGTAQKSIAKKVCEIMGGYQIQGYNSYMSCVLSKGKDCLATFKSALQPFGHTVETEQVPDDYGHTRCKISW